MLLFYKSLFIIEKYEPIEMCSLTSVLLFARKIIKSTKRSSCLKRHRAADSVAFFFFQQQQKFCCTLINSFLLIKRGFDCTEQKIPGDITNSKKIFSKKKLIKRKNYLIQFIHSVCLISKCKYATGTMQFQFEFPYTLTVVEVQE